mmetsp:Transcript_4821/g.11869  ORF Transcript_4821/g.11869 Transcript_4821/m.11869 type:complete len:208 (+) Transcript_4821:442-1065(+)
MGAKKLRFTAARPSGAHSRCTPPPPVTLVVDALEAVFSIGARGEGTACLSASPAPAALPGNRDEAGAAAPGRDVPCTLSNFCSSTSTNRGIQGALIAAAIVVITRGGPIETDNRGTFALVAAGRKPVYWPRCRCSSPAAAVPVTVSLPRCRCSQPSSTSSCISFIRNKVHARANSRSTLSISRPARYAHIAAAAFSFASRSAADSSR